MKIQEFLTALENELSSLTSDQRQEILSYFSEYLAEIEGNLEAMAELGTPQAVAQDLLSELQAQDVLYQAPQATHNVSHLAQALKLSLLDIDVELEATETNEIRLHIPESIRSALEVRESDGLLSIRQTQELASTVVWRFITFKQFSSSQKIRIELPKENTWEQISLYNESGDLMVSQVHADSMTAELLNGDLELAVLQLQSATIKLQNGDLELRGSAVEEFEAVLQNGDVDIENSRFNQAKTHLQNGDMDAENTDIQQLELTVANGDVDWQDVRAGKATCQLTNGDFDGQVIHVDSNLSVVTAHGDIDLKLSTSVGEAWLSAEAEFGDCSIETQQGKQESADGRIEQGNPTATLRILAKSSFGDVNCRVV